MMAQITRSRKYSSAAILLSLATQIHAQSGERLPIIQNVGIIPVQWEGSADPALAPFKAVVSKAFPEAVRTSYRFRPLNDELVASLWSAADGRAKLAEEYELQALVSLSVLVRPDIVTYQARLMNTKLEPLLAENESMSLPQALAAEEEDLQKRVGDLVFRLFNRLPVDMTVIAVQGRFITLSGGAKQNVHVGDEIDIRRSTIGNLHPADGTWLDFKNQKLGTASVVDVKTLTSVARLTNLSYENAVEVGDGVKVTGIAGRVRFQRLAETAQFKDAGANTTVLKPLYNEAAPPPAAPAPKAAPTQTATGATSLPPPTAPAEAAPSTEEPPQAEPQDEGEQVSFMDVVKHLFKAVSATAAIRSWSLKGDGQSSSSSLPPWLFNHFGANVHGAISEAMAYEGGAFLSLGLTGNQYMGGGLAGRGIYKLNLGGALPVSTLRFGADAVIETLNVPDGEIGGGNFVTIGGFAGAADVGRFLDQDVEWTSDLFLTILGLGQVGVAGTLESISGVLGYGLRGNVFAVEGANKLEWGAGFKYGTQTISYGSGGSIKFDEIMLQLNARYRF